MNADHAVPWRVFLGVGVFIAVLAIIYWFVSYEDAGTTMLVLASCLALFCGLWFYLQDRKRGVATAGATGSRDAEASYLPDTSVWPIAVGAGAALALNGLILGWAFAVPGVALLGLAVVGFVVQSRRRV
jgi:hypothetical protein